MVRVLYVNGNILKRGGIESFMMNYFRHIDREKVRIDFLVHGYEKGVYDAEIEASGCKIYHVPTKSKHPIKYVRELRALFKQEKFDIVHSHLDAMSGWILKIAKECDVPVRIAHSHNTDHLTTNRIKRIVNNYAMKQIPCYATDLFACSSDAGRWLFGNQRFQIINNAIDMPQYAFDEEKRKAIRDYFGWQDQFVIGHVGRFDYQKNQELLIEIIPEVIGQRDNAMFVFVGDGDDLVKAKELANKLGVGNKCVFLGSRNDVYDIYNAFDIFALPSRFEGLGIVAIEAQTNGLECLLSDRIPESACICNSVNKLPIEDKNAWIKSIIECTGMRHLTNYERVVKAGYSIDRAAEKLMCFYLEKGKK